MNDTEFKLYRALYFYKKTRDGKSYQDVLDALRLCLEEDCNGYLAARVETVGRQEMVKPGVIPGDDERSYYLMTAAEDDMANLEDEGMIKVHVNLRATLKSVCRDTRVGGICLNPWDGGCFVTREEIQQLLDTLQK